MFPKNRNANDRTDNPPVTDQVIGSPNTLPRIVPVNAMTAVTPAIANPRDVLVIVCSLSGRSSIFN